MTNLAVHYLPTHGRRGDLHLIQEVSDKLVKYASSGKPDANGLRTVWDLLAPGGFLILRNVAMTNQTGDVVQDPVGTGIRHAREWLDQIREFPYLDPDRVRVESANEIPMWGGVSPSVCNDYNCAFADELNHGGWLAMLGQINTGWPANTGEDTPSDWKPFDGMLDRLSFFGNWLGLHEYFGTPGPRAFMAGWWAYRYRHLLDFCFRANRPQPPIVINELGLAKEFQFIDGGWGQNPEHGWMGSIAPERYMKHLLDYAHDSAADGIIAATVFTTDGGHPWIDSMDTEGIEDLWLQAGQQTLGHAPRETEQPPIKVFVPNVVMDGPQFESGEAELDNMQIGELARGAISPVLAQAIMDIEAGGESHGIDGRMIIRFEAHIFQDMLDDARADMFDRHFQISEPEPWKNQQWIRAADGTLSPIHTGNQATEYAALKVARQIDVEAACSSVSMGIAQIMGFNHARLGYLSAETMYEDFGASTTAQIVGFFNFILGDDSLLQAIHDKNWRKIATAYNGAGNVDVYSQLLETAYWKRIAG